MLPRMPQPGQTWRWRLARAAPSRTVRGPWRSLRRAWPPAIDLRHQPDAGPSVARADWATSSRPKARRPSPVMPPDQVKPSRQRLHHHSRGCCSLSNSPRPRRRSARSPRTLRATWPPCRRRRGMLAVSSATASWTQDGAVSTVSAGSSPARCIGLHAKWLEGRAGASASRFHGGTCPP